MTHEPRKRRSLKRFVIFQIFRENWKTTLSSSDFAAGRRRRRIRQGGQKRDKVDAIPTRPHAGRARRQEDMKVTSTDGLCSRWRQ